MGGGHGPYQTDTSICDTSHEIQGHSMFTEAQDSATPSSCTKKIVLSINYQTKKGIIRHGLKARETDAAFPSNLVLMIDVC
jgi:hypothetical protein